MRRRKRKRYAAVVMIVMLAMLLSACSTPMQEGAGNGVSSQQVEDAGGQAAGKRAGNGQNAGIRDEGQGIGGQAESGQELGTQVKGRYREEKLEFPVPIKNIFAICAQEGRVQMLSEHEPGTFFLCESADAGASWQRKEMGMEWLPEDYRVAAACFGGEGEIFVSAGKMSTEPMGEQQAVGEYSYYKLETAEGGFSASPLSLELPAVEGEYDAYGLQQLAASADGKLYGLWDVRKGENSECCLYCFDLGENGAVCWSAETKMANIFLSEKTLYLDAYEDTVQKLDASTGKKAGEVPMRSADFRNVDILGQKFFYCNEAGIYGADQSLALTEQLVDGALSSFSDISYSIRKFCAVSEKVFLVFLEDSEGRLEGLRYEYDPELPTQPQQQLVVYSMEKDNIVKKLVADFQASHPEVYVRYEVGQKDSGIQEADAIHALNTEIVAGNGPDVLVLNGLPWESYGEKGILADMGQELEGSLAEGKLFPSVFEAFQMEGAQYVVPVSFAIPVLIGEKEQLPALSSSSLERLAEAVEKAEGESPLSIQGFWPFAASICWQEIQQQDGTLSREGLKRFLQAGKQICDRVEEKAGGTMYFFDAFGDWEDEEGKVHAGEPDVMAPVWELVYETAEMGMGYLGTVEDFTAISDHMPGQDLGYQALGEGVFHAKTMGVNGKSAQEALGKEFLLFAIGEEEQRRLQEELPGINQEFPVNRAVWEERIIEPAEGEREKYQEIFAVLGGTFTWPTEQKFEALEETVAGLKEPAMEDKIVLTAIQEGAKAYVSGKKTIDDAVNSVMQKLELYWME